MTFCVPPELTTRTTLTLPLDDDEVGLTILMIFPLPEDSADFLPPIVIDDAGPTVLKDVPEVVAFSTLTAGEETETTCPELAKKK